MDDNPGLPGIVEGEILGWPVQSLEVEPLDEGIVLLLPVSGPEVCEEGTFNVGVFRFLVEKPHS